MHFFSNQHFSICIIPSASAIRSHPVRVLQTPSRVFICGLRLTSDVWRLHLIINLVRRGLLVRSLLYSIWWFLLHHVHYFSLCQDFVVIRVHIWYIQYIVNERYTVDWVAGVGWVGHIKSFLIRLGSVLCTPAPFAPCHFNPYVVSDCEPGEECVRCFGCEIATCRPITRWKKY